MTMNEAAAIPLRVGVIGTGARGSRFARRLLSAGHEVHACNRTPHRAEALRGSGVIVQPSPRAVAEHADVLICMVWDSAALRAVALGAGGVVAGLAPPAVVADRRPGAAAGCPHTAPEVAQAGAAMLDTPASRSPDAAARGQRP